MKFEEKIHHSMLMILRLQKSWRLLIKKLLLLKDIRYDMLYLWMFKYLNFWDSGHKSPSFLFKCNVEC